jgi:hypothetical protein
MVCLGVPGLAMMGRLAAPISHRFLQMPAHLDLEEYSGSGLQGAGAGGVRREYRIRGIMFCNCIRIRKYFRCRVIVNMARSSY